MGVRSSSTKNRQCVITRRRCLNRTVSAQAPTPDVKLACVALLMIGIILECGPTFQASAALVPCSTRILCCKPRTLQTRLQTGVLRLDVVALEVHQNYCSCVCELSRPTFDSLRKNLAWWVVTQKEDLKNHRTVKIWGDTFPVLLALRNIDNVLHR